MSGGLEFFPPLDRGLTNNFVHVKGYVFLTHFSEKCLKSLFIYVLGGFDFFYEREGAPRKSKGKDTLPPLHELCDFPKFSPRSGVCMGPKFSPGSG